MRKLPVLIVATLFLLGMVSGHPFSMEMIQEHDAEHLQQEANIYGDEVPGILGSLIGSQTINILIESENRSEKLGVKLEETTVVQVQKEYFEDPSLKVNITETQLESITESETPIQKANTVIKEDKIKYRTRGMVNKFRTYLAENILSIASTF